MLGAFAIRSDANAQPNLALLPLCIRVDDGPDLEKNGERACDQNTLNLNYVYNVH